MYREFSQCAQEVWDRARLQRSYETSKFFVPPHMPIKKYGLTHRELDLDLPCAWNNDSVVKILENEVYLGNTLNLRYSTKSYKDKRKTERPREECIVTENTHDPIIDRETWDIVQEIRKGKRRMTRYGDQSIFAGLLYCADCGRKLDYCRGKTVKQFYYRCRVYKKGGIAACTPHQIRECVLEDVVLQDLQMVTSMAREHIDEFAAYIGKRQTAEQHREIRTLERELVSLRKRKNELDTIFRRLYEDSVLGRITTEQFQNLSAGYNEEQTMVSDQIEKKTALLEVIKNEVADTTRFIEKAKRYTEILELSTELLHLFIDKIVVHEKEVKYSKHGVQAIDIYYKDIGCLSNSGSEAKAV